MILQSAQIRAIMASKPRASGDDPEAIEREIREPLVNPARAGMIRHRERRKEPQNGKPRASGDDPNASSSSTTSAL